MKKNDGLKHRIGSWLDRDNVAGYVFVLPFIIGVIVFTAVPFFTSLYLSFTEYNVLSDPKWVGLANFKEMFFEDDLFWTSFWVTFKFAFIQVPIKADRRAAGGAGAGPRHAADQRLPRRVLHPLAHGRQRRHRPAVEAAVLAQRRHQPDPRRLWPAQRHRLARQPQDRAGHADRAGRVAVRLPRC